MMLFKRLSRRWGRNLLTVVAISVSFSMLLALSSVSLGLHRTAEERLREGPRDIVISSQGLSPSIESSHQLAEDLAKDENFSAVMPVLTLLGRLTFDNDQASNPPWSHPPPGMEDLDAAESRTMGMVGIIPDMADDFMTGNKELFIRSDLLVFNNWFNEERDPFHESNYTSNWTGELILDETTMEEYSLDVGDPAFFVGDDGSIEASFLIVGTVRTSIVGGGLTSGLLGGIAVVHLGELQFVTDNSWKETPQGPRADLSTAIYIDLVGERSSRKDQEEVSLHLQNMFPGLDVTNKESRLYRIDEEVLVLEVFSISVAASTISIGVLFLSSIMIIEVEERRSDIAIMRSIGISRKTIFSQIVRDSMFLSIAGAVLGTVPGYLGSKLLDSYLQDLYGVDLDFARFEPWILFSALAYLLLLVGLFSLIPAFRATTIVPVKGMASHYNR
ncbi:MAG: ABC transporter permease [Thermoplasmatota archaeon]